MFLCMMIILQNMKTLRFSHVVLLAFLFQQPDVIQPWATPNFKCALVWPSLGWVFVDGTHFICTVLSAGGLRHSHSYDILGASNHLSLNLYHFCHLAEVHVVVAPVVLDDGEIQGISQPFIVHIGVLEAAYQTT